MPKFTIFICVALYVQTRCFIKEYGLHNHTFHYAGTHTACSRAGAVGEPAAGIGLSFHANDSSAGIPTFHRPVRAMWQTAVPEAMGASISHCPCQTAPSDPLLWPLQSHEVPAKALATGPDHLLVLRQNFQAEEGRFRQLDSTGIKSGKASRNLAAL